MWKKTAEHELAHQVGTETQPSYRRTTALKKRRVLLEDWAAYLSTRNCNIDLVHMQDPTHHRDV